MHYASNVLILVFLRLSLIFSIYNIVHSQPYHTYSYHPRKNSWQRIQGLGFQHRNH